MDWKTSCSNAAVRKAFDEYTDFVLRIATLHAGTRLVESVDLSAFDPSYRLKLSDDFPDEATTIRTVGQLSESIASGEYCQLALGLAIVQLCTAMEIFVDAISELYGVGVSKADTFIATHHIAVGGALEIGNRSLMQVRKLHTTLGIDTVLNRDETLIKLAAIVEVRNCVAHAGGVVMSQKVVNRLRAYAIPASAGGRLFLKPNLLDDFLHYMASHLQAFSNRLP